ncbi:MAG: PCP reductase family protein [Nitrospinae bacterium]|nr:PCP reductase family protein [Nitrospinota bacterium]
MAANPEWTDEARKTLERVPFFARSIAKKMIEEYAAEKGAREVTPEIMREARAKFGM